MAIKTVGHLKGSGVLHWKDRGPIDVRYEFTGRYSTVRDSISKDGYIFGAAKELRLAEGRSDVVMTIEDGRKLDVAILGVKSSGEASISVNSDIEEFTKHFRQL